MLSSPAFVALVLAGGLNMGFYGLWSGVLTKVLPFDENTNGYFGLVNTVCSVIGGCV